MVYQPFAEVDALQNNVNQRVRETVCFAKILNPGWEGVKSIPKTNQVDCEFLNLQQSLPINGRAIRADLFGDPDSCCGVEHQQCWGIL